MPFRCTTCGQDHDGLPDVGHAVPHPWLALSDAERAARGECGTDLCRLDDDYFIRGVIELPLTDAEGRFGFGAWVSQKQENYETYVSHPDTPAIGPFFGWLSTRIDYYQPADTLRLKTRAHFVGGGQRPRIELDPDDPHPLAVAQREGITLATAWEIVHFYTPPAPPPKPARRWWWR